MKPVLLSLALFPCLAFASGGYDHGTPAGKGNLDLDFTLNPGNSFKDGQSYVVWGYGITDTLDFHGYASHEADGTNQLYIGLMYNFYSNNWLDLSTAVGFRERENDVDVFAPQLLYTFKLPKRFDIGGSVVYVYNLDESFGRGTTYDLFLRIPFPESWLPSFMKEAKLAVGAFRNASGNTNPTYSIDLKF
jgi:hypothetical protein